MKNIDPKLVAKNQIYEVYYISGKFHIPVSDVKKAIKAVGRSRKKIYAELRKMGYTIKTKAVKNQ